ncbi:MAG: cation-transporting P-type ATPase, partial [Vicinamibacteria bacterium]
MTTAEGDRASASPTGSPGGETPSWHAMSGDAVLAKLAVSVESGLSGGEAAARLGAYGPNKFADAPAEPRWRAFLRQYQDPMQIVLLIAGVISLFLPGQFATGILLIVLTLLNAAMGLNQEGKAEASVSALQKLMVVKAKVRRDGQLAELAMADLVPGDIVNI